MTVKHLYPNSTPALKLNFKSSRVADPSISFTRSSTATYVDPVSGLVKTAAANVARVGRDGLLVEESRTNSIKNSTGLTNVSGINGPGPSASTVVCPDGSTTGGTVTNTSQNAGVMISTSSVAAGTYIGSIYARSRTGAEQQVKTAISGSSGPVTTLPANGDWVRCFSDTYALGGSSSLTLRLLANSSSGMNVDFWGYQIETGSFATSYIPTSGSTVTRSADVASMTGTNFSSWYNQNAGTWIGTVNTTVPTTARLLEVGVPSYSISIRPGPTSTSIARNASGADTINHTYPATFGATNNVTQIRLWVNGTAGTAVTTGSQLTNSTKFSIGQTVSDTSQVNAPIANISFYPTLLINSQLQALTQ